MITLQDLHDLVDLARFAERCQNGRSKVDKKIAPEAESSLEDKLAELRAKLEK